MNSGSLFVPEIEQVNPAWYKEWGKAIGSPELADEMFNNQRLRSRVHEQLVHSGELKVDARFSAAEIACLNSYSQDKKQLERICGLVVYGKVLRENISKADFDKLAKIIPVSEMKIAVSLRDHHSEDIEYSVDMARLDELVQRTGKSCVSLWKQGLRPQMRIRVDLLDQPSMDEGSNNDQIDTDRAEAIVEAVVLTMQSEALRLAA